MQHIVNPAYYQDYILAGNSHFLLINTKSEKQDIFRVKRSKWENRSWTVSNQSFQKLGVIKYEQDDLFVFEGFNPSFSTFHLERINMFWNFWLWAMKGKHSPLIELRYDGRCGRCQRELTHPESLPIGIGPDCFEKMNLTHKTLITYESGQSNTEHKA